VPDPNPTTPTTTSGSTTDSAGQALIVARSASEPARRITSYRSADSSANAAASSALGVSATLTRSRVGHRSTPRQRVPLKNSSLQFRLLHGGTR
jgi:hypothetical protein